MTYNTGTPQPFDLPADSQPDFLSNFFLINQFFGNDHVPFDSISNNGYHKKVSFATTSIRQDFPPPIASLFTQSIQNKSELIFQNDVGATFLKVMTNLLGPSTYIETTAGKGIKTPWGLIINFGQINFSVPGITYNFPYTYTTSVYSILSTPFINGIGNNRFANVASEAISNSQFTATGILQSSPSGTLVPGFYMSIGK